MRIVLISILVLTLPFRSVQGQSSYQKALNYYTNGIQDSAAYYFNKIIKHPSNHFSKEIGYSNYYLGAIFKNLRKRDSMVVAYSNALAIFLHTQDSAKIAKCYYELSYARLILGKYDASIKDIQNAIAYYKSLNNTAELSKAYFWYSVIYHDIAEYKLGIKYGFKSYNLGQSIKNDSIKATLSALSLNAIAISYDDNNQPDSAIFYHKKVISLKPILPDTMLLARTYNNIGNSYMKKGMYEQADYYFKRNLKINLYKNEPYGLATVYTNLGTIAYYTNNYKKAQHYLRIADSISFAINDVEKIQDVLYQEYKFMEKVKHWPQALAFLRQYHQFKDSLLTKEKLTTIQKLETIYNTKEKEAQLKQQSTTIAFQKKLLQKNHIIIATLILLLVLLLAFGMLYKNWLGKQAQFKIQQKELDYKKVQIANIIETQEKERARVSSELHDSIGQSISLLKLNVNAVKNKPDTTNKILTNSEQILNNMVVELRNICANLMPVMLIKEGLVPSLQLMANRINKTGQIHVTLQVFGLPKRLPEHIEIALYRIVQEWVNNIIKYSQATTINVQLTSDSTELTLTIDDNGSGFDKNLLTQNKGNGYKNITNRLEHIMGKLEIETAPGSNGTLFIINVPLPTSKND